MRLRSSICFALLMLFAAGSAKAWPSCPGVWNQVQNGTKATGSSGQLGEIYTADGITWQCQPKNSTPPTNPPGSSATSSSSSSSNSSSSSTSGVNNSGNSSNKNTNTATGGNANAQGGNAQGGNAQGGNAQGGSASNQGNNSSYQNSTTVESAKIPVDTAYAPTAIPTAPCFKGFGAGVQTAPVGASFGGGKIDPNCAILEVARSFGISGARTAYCKTMITNKYAKKAGVTFEDCMKNIVVEQPNKIITPVSQLDTVPVSGTTVPVQVTPEPVLHQTMRVYEGSFVALDVRAPGCATTSAVIGTQGSTILTKAIGEAGSDGLFVLVGAPRYIIPAFRFLSKSVQKNRISMQVDDSQSTTVVVRTSQVQTEQ